MQASSFVAALLFATATLAADDPFSQLVAPDAKVQKLAGGMQFIEGPVWTSADGGYLIFSDIPPSELKKWDGKTLTTYRKSPYHQNGNTRDPQGRLITCEHASRRVVREENPDELQIIADYFEGQRFNSPNDVVVKSDGSIWFTDPSYGLPNGEKKQLDGCFVFRVDPRGNITKVATDFDMPNGLCFSPDEKKLYIADSGKPHHIRVFDVKPDGSLADGAVVCVIDTGVPDGIRCDEKGNIWSSAGDGVHVFSPSGKLLGKIPVPETPANLCFGGRDGRTLFITARTSLYSIPTLVRGAMR